MDCLTVVLHFRASVFARMDLARESDNTRNVLLGAGYGQMPNGSWKPPLGKRPDFEGDDLIKAAIEMFRASAVVQQAVQRYEEARK
jgi:hypothetical protein